MVSPRMNEADSLAAHDSSRMRAALFDAELRRVTVEQVPIPRPGPTEILMQVCRCGVCGSDVAMTGDGPLCFVSGRFGHEYAGVVEEVGREVSSHRPGDLIAAYPVAGCGSCESCRAGHYFSCASRGRASFGFADYAVLSPDIAIRIPQSVGVTAGALVEPMACGLHALMLSGFQAGDRVLVLGAGSMALSVIYWARRLGASRIVALARSLHRAEVAKTMGVDALVSNRDEDRSKVMESLGGPADLVVECVGKPGMLGTAVEWVRPRGAVASLGMCMWPEKLTPALLARKEVRLFFPLGYTMNEFIASVREFEAGRIPATALVSDLIALEDLPETLEAIRAGRGGLKTQVDLTRRPV